jgi:hypothetical protein
MRFMIRRYPPSHAKHARHAGAASLRNWIGGNMGMQLDHYWTPIMIVPQSQVAIINDAIRSTNDSLDCRECADAAVSWPMIAAVKIKAARVPGQ